MHFIIKILCLCIFYLYISFASKNKEITNEQDYLEYIVPGKANESPALIQIERDLEFWKERSNRYPDDLSGQIKVAALLSKRYSYSGDINDMHLSDSLYRIANQFQKKFSSALYRSLAANDITQHRFREAFINLDSALQMGDDKSLTMLQRFDVELELGNAMFAQQILNDFANKTSFEFLSRDAKLKDHHGKLNAAIQDMEMAVNKVKLSENKNLYSWTMATLGDMYGHANRYKESYHAYLEVLETDPAYYHALKGIAWLALSHDKNTKAAKKNLEYLKNQHPVPEYDLLLAEVAAYENNNELKDSYLRSFVTEAGGSKYGDMYNKYLFSIYSDVWNEYDKALQIAQREIRNRPTPDSYHLLSWALFKSGKIEEAMETIEKYVSQKCFEPDAKYHLGMIYSGIGNKEMANTYLKEALMSSYELGPVTTSEIQKFLKRQ